MEEKSQRRSNVARADLRRQQILAAAAACFRRDGFHGASMSKISECAGMSTGHIYHYFKSKEAIVDAIVAAQQQTGLVHIERARGADNIFEALIGGVEDAFQQFVLAVDPALILEVRAEASRNPVVGDFIRAKEEIMRRSIEDMLSAGQRQGVIEPNFDAGHLSVLLMAIFEGLGQRRALCSDMDLSPIMPLFQTMLRRLLSPAA